MKVIFLVGGNETSRKEWKIKQDPGLHTFIEGYQYTKLRLMTDLENQLYKGKTCIIDLNVPHEDIKSFSLILGRESVSVVRINRSSCKG